MTKIITVPDPRLRQKSTPIDKLDKKTLKLISDLQKTLQSQADPEGVGLSAPQIGVNKRVFIIRSVIPDKDASSADPESRQDVTQGFDVPGSRVKARDDKLAIIVNPEILEYSKDTNWDHLAAEDHYFEGCLSIPGVYGEVVRPWTIKVKYQTINNDHNFPQKIGSEQRERSLQMTNDRLTGFEAVYFQHEFDHLEGVLFTDHVLKQGGKLYEQTAKGEFEGIS